MKEEWNSIPDLRNVCGCFWLVIHLKRRWEMRGHSGRRGGNEGKSGVRSLTSDERVCITNSEDAFRWENERENINRRRQREVLTGGHLTYYIVNVTPTAADWTGIVRYYCLLHLLPCVLFSRQDVLQWEESTPDDEQRRWERRRGLHSWEKLSSASTLRSRLNHYPDSYVCSRKKSQSSLRF